MENTYPSLFFSLVIFQTRNNFLFLLNNFLFTKKSSILHLKMYKNLLISLPQGNFPIKKLLPEQIVTNTHYRVWRAIRNVIKELGWTMPEELETPKKSTKILEKEKGKN